MRRAACDAGAGRGLGQYQWGPYFGGARSLRAAARAAGALRRGGAALAELHRKAVSLREEGGGGDRVC
jgi:hypothetical protein